VARLRFLISPRWVLSHLLVILLVVVMINLGFWQLRRLDEKRDRNALVEARMDQPEVPLGDLLDAGDGGSAVDGVRYRKVRAIGTYDEGATIQVRNRSQDGAPGAWLVTPIAVEGGERVGVIRGFVGFRPDGSFEPAEAPSGRVTVTGLAMDPDRLGGTAGHDLRPLLAEDGVLPALLMADASDPPEPNGSDGADPEQATLEPVPKPELDEGPHLGYAVQWFIFSTIAAVGYPIVLRRVVIRRGKEAGDAESGAGDGGDGGPDDMDSELEDLLREGK
jgi:surfeit locus 1 family protein